MPFSTEPHHLTNMTNYLVLAKILDKELFGEYMRGHLPTIQKYGGRVAFRSTENKTIFGSDQWDAIAIQEWPNAETFDLWWNSKEYEPWSKIRDKAALVQIIKTTASKA